MIKIVRIKDCDSERYRFMTALLTVSFPKKEYRDLDELRSLTETEGRFHNNIIYDNDKPIGLITYWDFTDFYYIEHFAICPDERSKGYGAATLYCLKETLRCPIVLEVEMPDNAMACRRIGFYERQGFTLWDNPYMQPPYRKGDQPLPMRIMVYGDLKSTSHFRLVEQTIHCEVYFAFN